MTMLDTELPFMATIGIDNALSITVFDDDGVTPLVATEGTLTVTDGSETLEQPDVTAGATSTATLAAASTDGRLTSTRLLFTWLLTIATVKKPYLQSAYLVNNQLYPVLTDQMLTDRLPHLISILGTSPTSLKQWRISSWNELQRWLIIKGKRLDLALDQWAFVDMHRYWALEHIAEYLHTSTGDIDWDDKRLSYKALRMEQQDTLNLRFDTDADGKADETEKNAVQGSIWLNAPRPLSRIV